VLVNGRRVGQLPLEHAVRVSAGSVDVELSAAGYTRGFRTVTVAPGQYQTVVIRLEKIAAPPPKPIDRDPVLTGGPGPSPPPPAPRPWQRWAALGAFGGGAVAAGAGVYGVLRHNDRVGAFNKKCGEGPQGPINKSTGQADQECNGLQSDYHGARTLSIVGFSVAGALAATGTVLLLTAPEPTSRAAVHQRLAWACAPDFVRTGATCAVRF
jgi:PEGA domain-containing protein